MMGSDEKDEVDRLAAFLKHHMGDSDLTLGDEYHYASLPLCIIDAVYSMGVRYSGTQNTVRKWAQRVGWPVLATAANKEHTISVFVDLMGSHSVDELAGEAFFANRQRTSSTSGILKAEAVKRFAKVLQDCGVECFDDIVGKYEKIEGPIKGIPGQKSGICFSYFLMLAGRSDQVKPDRMICRFVTNALGLPKEVSPQIARKLVTAAAEKLGKTAREVDNWIWKYQRQQKLASSDR